MPETLEMRVTRLEQRLASDEELYRVRYENDKEGIKTALAANDKRLDGLNEFRLALSDQTARSMPREDVLQMFASASEKGELARNGLANRLEAQLRPLEAKVEAIGRPNWALLASSIGVVAVVVSGLFVVIGLKIDTSATPMTLAIEQLKADAFAKDRRFSDSAANRERQLAEMSRQLAAMSQDLSAATTAVAQLRSVETLNVGRITTIEQTAATTMADRRAAQGLIQARLTEVETQFATVATVINLMKDDTHQMIGVLWSKLFPDVRLPDKSYRPRLHRDTPDPN